MSNREMKRYKGQSSGERAALRPGLSALNRTHDQSSRPKGGSLWKGFHKQSGVNPESRHSSFSVGITSVAAFTLASIAGVRVASHQEVCLCDLHRVWPEMLLGAMGF
jgi:hypothetical protein